MSYASIAAHDAPPPSEQPHPDPALLTTERSPSSNVIDDTSKVNVISRDEDPSTRASDVYIPEDTKSEFISTNRTDSERKGKGSRHLQEARAEGSYLWDVTRHYLLRPGVAGGLVGLVNIGLLSGVGYTFYTKPDRRNFTAIGSSAVAALLVIGAEGYAAEKYTEISRGNRGERRTRERSTLLYKHFREHILRPGVLGGSVGLVNSAILGAVGYYSYANWNKPKWNRDIVTAISLGLLTLWWGESYVAERYRSERRRQ